MITLPGALDGERLDRVVATLTGCTRAQAATLVSEGSVMVDGAVERGRARRLREGMDVAVLAAVPDDDAPAGEPGVEVVVVDADPAFIVVDKPAGLVVHPGAGHTGGTLVNGLLSRFPEIAEVGAPDRPGIVHRLDKGTSGLLVVARTPAAHRSLSEQFRTRRAGRRYLTLVTGELESAQGVIDAPVGRSARQPTRMAVAAGGRPARTAYEVVRRFHEPFPATLLRCSLETGRTHQIRVHLAAIGHPVLGDDRYNPARGDGGTRPAGVMAARPFLHAEHLAFEHPVTGAPVSHASPLPADLGEVLDGFR